MAKELVPLEVQNDREALMVVMKADEVVEASELITVDNAGELTFAGEYLRDLVTARDKVQAAYDRVLAPLKLSLDALDAFFGEPIRQLNEVEKRLKAAILKFTTDARASAELSSEAARHDRMERAHQLRDKAAEVEALSVTADTLADRQNYAQLAEAYRSEAHALEASTLPASIVVPTAEGVSVRSSWRGEVTDLDALWEAAYNDHTLRTLFVVPDAKANEYARLTKGARTVPGLRVYNKGSVAAKRRKGAE